MRPDGATLTVNLFLPSVLNWTQRGIAVTQTTSYPADDTTALKVTGSVGGTWSMRVRIPAWTSGATISVNGVAQTVTADPGTYATLTRSWASGDTVTVKLPMRVVLQAAADDPGVAAITYGPAVLAGNYGSTTLSSLPALDPSSITRTGSTALAFTALANGTEVDLTPFHDAQGFDYTVYWRIDSQRQVNYRARQLS
ncbi:glycoside hydrolase family 127 protein [Streptomyces sp. ISL-43]|nr:glycoside hydrolase family 127 protein [Streptomyces sp. ISL-43]